jgi:hypothetical protein
MAERVCIFCAETISHDLPYAVCEDSESDCNFFLQQFLKYDFSHTWEVKFGKYKGFTFEKLFTTQRNYCKWVVDTMKPDDKLRQFICYRDKIDIECLEELRYLKNKLKHSQKKSTPVKKEAVPRVPTLKPFSFTL